MLHDQHVNSKPAHPHGEIYNRLFNNAKLLLENSSHYCLEKFRCRSHTTSPHRFTRSGNSTKIVRARNFPPYNIMVKYVALDLKKGLIFYNSLSAGLWLFVLFLTLVLGGLVGQPFLFEKTNVILTGVQTVSLVEVFNAATGRVRSPLLTTALQVASRLMLVWGIFQFNKESPANYSVAYVTLCLAWATTEIIRYLYFASYLRDARNVPRWLTWLRYLTFFVLYPVGVASELYLIYGAIAQNGTFGKVFLAAVMLSYIPGFPMLFSLMIKNRKRALNKEKDW